MQENSNNWHSLDHRSVLSAFDSTTAGLSDEEVQLRLQRYGPNRLTPPKKKSALMRFLNQFRDVLIYVLLVAAAVTFALGHLIDTSVIMLVVFINAIIAFIQEGKAEKAMDAIGRMLANYTMVQRAHGVVTIPAEELVPGDIVLLRSGDRVPADLRLFRVKNLRIDEALLTGESDASHKDTLEVAAESTVGDRVCMAYSGTFVTYGQGQGVVVATGDDTEIGRISGMLGGIQTLTTPLLRQTADFAAKLSIAIVAVAALTSAFGVLVHHYTATEMFLAAVGLAVAAIPEGLPAIMTITLAIGVQKMAHRNAIIRRLPAVETLGSVTTICSDKTGTLTKSEMTAVAVTTGGGSYRVSGEGYDPHGGFVDSDGVIQENLDAHPALRELCRAAMLCNDSSLREKNGIWTVQGDPTEAALLTLGMKAGLDIDFQKELWPRTDVIPFESEHKFMATLHHDHAGHGFIYVKGAPEKVLEMCRYQRKRGEDVLLDRSYWHTNIETMADRGQRLMAIAIRPATNEQQTLNYGDIADGLSLLGVIGIMDPPRQEAKAAIAACHNAGIAVKMITGDHDVTARAIARDLGLVTNNGVVTGAQIDAADDAALQRLVVESNVFARTTPEHKLRLVKALQENGDVVAMTGDGVNDAPALKRADVGVAMGKKGTEVAREAAEMVLTDDNFASIVDAVHEGRTVYDNLKKSILFILPTNGGEALTIIAAIIMGRMLPITAAQILWINMITAVTLALALAFEPAERNIMQRKPRDADEPLLSGFLVWRIVFVSIILVSGTFGMFLWHRLHGAPIEEARTVAVNTLVMFEIFYLFSARHLTSSSLNREGLFGNSYALLACAVLIVMQLAFTYAPPMQKLFNTVPLDATSWIEITIIASSVLFLVELEKWWLRYRLRRK